MSTPLDDAYLTWLYSQVGSVHLKNPARTSWKLMRQLYKKEFVWFVPNDDNRVVDGLCLRKEFLEAEHIQDVDPNWLNLGCSMLELLIGLARRLSFEDDGEPLEWFWEMLDNINLASLTDARTWAFEEVDDVLDTIIFRTYDFNGTGGLFPLKNATEDQRKVELWYQLNAYLLEKE